MTLLQGESPNSVGEPTCKAPKNRWRERKNGTRAYVKACITRSGVTEMRLLT